MGPGRESDVTPGIHGSGDLTAGDQSIAVDDTFYVGAGVDGQSAWSTQGSLDFAGDSRFTHDGDLAFEIAILGDKWGGGRVGFVFHDARFCAVRGHSQEFSPRSIAPRRSRSSMLK